MKGQNQREFLRETVGEDTARAYDSWCEMRRRIRHPLRSRKNGPNYVGLAISPEWETFDAFLRDMGPCKRGHSLDRIDPALGYSRANCRWADAKTQSRNRPYCRLNEAAATSIRMRYARGGISQQTIADEYGCSQVLISKVIRNESWV